MFQAMSLVTLPSGPSSNSTYLFSRVVQNSSSSGQTMILLVPVSCWKPSQTRPSVVVVASVVVGEAVPVPVVVVVFLLLHMSPLQQHTFHCESEYQILSYSGSSNTP